MKRNLLIAIVALMSSSVMAQTQLTEFTPSVTANGVNYALPKTRLRVDVTAMKVSYTPGEYARYAERYLHISGVNREASTQWSVTRLNVCQEGVPDTSKVYTVKMKDKTIAPMAQLTSSGILVAVNTTAEIDEPVLPSTSQTRRTPVSHRRNPFRHFCGKESRIDCPRDTRHPREQECHQAWTSRIHASRRSIAQDCA